MEIVHVEKDGNFTWMKNIHLRDRFLSLKAKGLLSMMFSLPKDWDCTITGLAYISKEGISAIRATIKELEAAGFQIRQPGCSACLAMNDDKIPAGKYSVSTSNRNFEGRQGPGSRTFLASPLTAAAAAITGKVTDPRNFMA